MPDIVGVRFKRAGKVYYFDPAGTELKVYDYVVVQTARGVELGQVTIAPKQVLAADIIAELKPIMRKATEQDIKRAQEYAAKEDYALTECAKIIQRLNLPMKLVIAEYNLDGSRLTFYFTADERVDFRELVRELTSFFKSRIELRQIGPRDQSKMIGGMGRCGRLLCCSSYLTEFNPVSIKMAKEQDLPLDPMKISGVCGRLQCCLAYESSMYHDIKAEMPKRGQRVSTPSGNGWITGIRPLKESVVVDLETQTSAEFPVSQIKVIDEPIAVPPPRVITDLAEETESDHKPAVNTQPAAPHSNQTEKPAQIVTPSPVVAQPAAALEIKPDSRPPTAIAPPVQNQSVPANPPSQIPPVSPNQAAAANRPSQTPPVSPNQAAAANLPSQTPPVSRNQASPANLPSQTPPESPKQASPANPPSQNPPESLNQVVPSNPPTHTPPDSSNQAVPSNPPSQTPPLAPNQVAPTNATSQIPPVSPKPEEKP